MGGHKYNVFVDPDSVRTGVKYSKAAIVVNPNSGNRMGLKTLSWLRPDLEKAGVSIEKVLETEYAGHAVELAAETDFTGIDLVLCIGGDGTAHETINGLMKRDAESLANLTLCLVPNGTGNTVAFDMGYEKPKEALKAILNGTSREIDVLELVDDEGNKTYSINIVGYGLPTAVMGLANKLRCCGCGAQYDNAGYVELLKRKGYDTEIVCKYPDGSEKVFDEKFMMVMIHNTVHMGKRMPFAPDAQLDDGLMDLVALTRRQWTRVAVAGMLTKAKKGTHGSHENLIYEKCSELTIRPKEGNKMVGANTLNVDGELTSVTPINIKVVPKALRVVVPESRAKSVALRPSSKT